MFPSRLRLAIFSLATAKLLLSPAGFAQTFNSGLRGTVTDATGAALPNATLTLTDEATQQLRSAVSAADGTYVFNAVRPATYTLHIQAAGFAPTDRTHIALATQDFLTLDVPLTVGAETNVVQVDANASLVDPSTASVSTDLSQRQLEDIPILGRNPYMTAKVSGVFVNTGNQQFVRFADQNGTSQTSVAGGPVAGKHLRRTGWPYWRRRLQYTSTLRLQHLSWFGLWGDPADLVAGQRFLC